MFGFLKRILGSAGLEVRKQPENGFQRTMVSLTQTGEKKGDVLLSYIPEVFTEANSDDLSHTHTHYWECSQIASAFLSRGFAVDVVHYNDAKFTPDKDYDILVSARTNLERLAKLLPPQCLKIAHLDTAHFLTNNANALARLVATRERRGVALRNLRTIEQNWALEAADIGCVLGNEFTINSYEYAAKPIYRIPISCTDTFEWPKDRNFEEARSRFLWFGSAGFVHKGLDLTLEAIKQEPELSLTVCGPTEYEKRFVNAFRTDLYSTPNIDTHGWIDVTSRDFSDICRRSIATIYPSCSEGGGGSVLTCMHAGLIPIVTREASVDVGDFGIVLPDGTIDDIRSAALSIAAMSVDELEERARAAWEYARANHTQATFADAYENFVETVVMPEWSKRNSK